MNARMLCLWPRPCECRQETHCDVRKTAYHWMRIAYQWIRIAHHWMNFVWIRREKKIRKSSK